MRMRSAVFATVPAILLRNHRPRRHRTHCPLRRLRQYVLLSYRSCPRRRRRHYGHQHSRRGSYSKQSCYSSPWCPFLSFRAPALHHPPVPVPCSSGHVAGTRHRERCQRRAHERPIPHPPPPRRRRHLRPDLRVRRHLSRHSLCPVVDALGSFFLLPARKDLEPSHRYHQAGKRMHVQQLQQLLPRRRGSGHYGTDPRRRSMTAVPVGTSCALERDSSPGSASPRPRQPPRARVRGPAAEWPGFLSRQARGRGLESSTRTLRVRGSVACPHTTRAARRRYVSRTARSTTRKARAVRRVRRGCRRSWRW